MLEIFDYSVIHILCLLFIFELSLFLFIKNRIQELILK